MNKYEPLKFFLEKQENLPVRLTFEEIEGIIDSSLPKSAYNYRAWWANDETHVQARDGWLNAEFKVKYVDLEEKIVVFVKESEINEFKIRDTQVEGGKPITKRSVFQDAREFEELARRVMSRYFNKELRKFRRSGWPKEFDLVSPDYEIVGDAKYYTMVRGKNLPPAKFATISEYVWMLENIDAQIKFLVFGNDIRVPVEWIKRYGSMVKTVKFYFINDEENVIELK